jgi:hypothetical protein
MLIPIVVLIIVVVGYLMMNKTPGDPTAPGGTFDLSADPPPAIISAANAGVEMYTDLNFEGTMRTVKAGRSRQFAKRNARGAVEFEYNSMKVVKGSMLMFTGQSGGNIYRAFAVGDEDVVDMHDFLKSYDSIYRDDGIFMAPDWNHWPGMVFKIAVLSEYDFIQESQKNYDGCMKWINSVADDKDEDYKLETCEPRLPSNNRSNITGFTDRQFSRSAEGPRPVFSREMNPY